MSTLVFNYRQMGESSSHNQSTPSADPRPDMLVAKGIAPSRASAKQPEPHHDTPAPTGSRERVDGRNGLPKGKRKSDSVKEEGEGSGFENPIDVEIQSLKVSRNTRDGYNLLCVHSHEHYSLYGLRPDSLPSKQRKRNNRIIAIRPVQRNASSWSLRAPWSQGKPSTLQWT